MNILVLTSTFQRWENDTDPPFIYTLCEQLAKQHCCYIVAPHTKGAKPKETLADNIHVYRYRYFFAAGETLAYDGGILNKLARKPWRLLLLPLLLLSQLFTTTYLLRKQSIDLIHAHWIIPHALTALLSRFLSGKSMPILCTAHGSDLYKFNHPFFNRLKKILLQKTDHLTVVSKGMQDYCQQQLNIKTDKISIIPMGTDFELFSQNPAIPKDVNTLVYIGRLIESKGVHILIKALSEVIKTIPTVKLQLVGDGPYKEQLIDLSRSLQLQQNIVFHGPKHQAELPDILSTASIAVVPALQPEGFGLSMVEAMGCECAVIASDSPAAREIIEHGISGLLVTAHDVQALAMNILSLLHAPKKIIAIGHRARKSVTARYHWDNTTQKFLNLLDRLTDTREAQHEQR